MDLGLRGRTAVVLGASEGMGRAVAERLAEEGCDLVLCARRAVPLEETAGEIAKRTGVRVHPVVADVLEVRDLERVFDAAEMESGRVDVLVTNHGGPRHGRLADLDDDDWMDAFDLIVLSAVRATRLALPLLAVRGGSVVHIVSTAAREPLDNLTLSNVLRPAVLGLTKTTSLELAPKGVRVNAVLPGSIRTQRHAARVHAQAVETGRPEEEIERERAAAIPLGRVGEPADVADAVAFLASDRARYVTGQAWAVDGGLLRTI